ncbi:MAG: ABC transporter permease [Anaerolineae bacterium]|nr:MAG: ABC transporter permease [Anaerolineae bacterium]
MTATSAAPRTLIQRVSNYLYVRPRVSLLMLLALPLLWFLIVYIGSLATLMVQSFFHLDGFTGQVVRQFSLSSYAQLFTPANVDIVQRTAGMAGVVTLSAALIAFPLAYFMARYASPRMRPLLYLSITLPLWSSYLVKVYSWKLILAKEGMVSWVINTLRLDAALDWLLGLPEIGGPSLSISPIGIYLVFLYVWLPYMILPIATALERVPKSLIEASGDLGGRPGVTFRRIILPLAFPGVVAGSIFTFSLTLGDFIVPSVMGNSSYFIGQAVLSHQGTSGNIPLAAAMTTIPMLIMGIYLYASRRAGAFDAL